jgi:hypothetical protein
MLAQPRAERLRIQCAGFLGNDLAIPKQHQGWDALDVVAAGQHRLHVSVDFQKRIAGSSSEATRSYTGAIALHGPHHCAQKSTSTGMSFR